MNNPFKIFNKPPAKNAPKEVVKENSWGQLFTRFNGLFTDMSRLPSNFLNETIYNIPQLQNRRVKSISTLPAGYTKEQIGEFLRNAYESEEGLRATSETLKWTAYPYYKIIKTYADIPSYKYYFTPKYLENNQDLMREAFLVDKFLKQFRPDVMAHEVVGKALTLGKVFYTYRYSLDKSHNKVNYAFWQQLPSDYLYIVGKNNISGWTVAFDMMYFMEEGTDIKQFGDLFDDFADDFNEMFKNPNKKVVYASVNCKGHELTYYPDNIKSNAKGKPRTFLQNGRWLYYVTLPVEKVFGFEIDDTNPNVAPALSGLMLTYAQQSNYEDAQLSLILNPLIKIFTGEIPYFDNSGTHLDDDYRLSVGGRELFQRFFTNMMKENNTAGTSFFTAPVENIKSHDFKEAANANEISESFNRYGMEKAGLAGLLPVQSDVKAQQVQASMLIEGRYATATIYPQIKKMIEYIFETMNLSFEWSFNMFGTIFNEAEIRKGAVEGIANGDISQHFILCALDGISWVDKLSMMNAIETSGILDKLKPPATSYTLSKGGRPETDDLTDEKEKSIDSGATK